jgi:hypothetical protein
MPIYFYECKACSFVTRRLLSKELPYIDCNCGATAQRCPKPPTVRITETLDNGVMVKRVERLADAEQIHDEMAHGKKGVI